MTNEGLGMTRSGSWSRPIDVPDDLDENGAKQHELTRVGVRAADHRSQRPHDVLGVPRLEKLDPLQGPRHVFVEQLELLRGRRWRLLASRRKGARCIAGREMKLV